MLSLTSRNPTAFFLLVLHLIGSIYLGRDVENILLFYWFYWSSLLIRRTHKRNEFVLTNANILAE